MFIVNAETIIQLETHADAVIDTLIVATVHVLQAVAHKVWLNRFHRILANREFITGKVLNPPGIAREVVMDIGFFGGQEVLIPTAAQGEGPVIRRPAKRGTNDILIV